MVLGLKMVLLYFKVWE